MVSEKKAGSSYRVHTGTQLVQLAAASGLSSEAMARELQGLLTTVAPHGGEGGSGGGGGSQERLQHILEQMLEKTLTSKKARLQRNIASIPSPQHDLR